MPFNRPDIFKRHNAFPTIADVVMLVVMFFVGSFTLGLVIKSAWTSLSAGFDDVTYSRMVRYGASMFGALIAMLFYRYARGVRGGVLRYQLKWFNGWLILVGLIGIAAIGIVEEPLWQLFPEWNMEQAIGVGTWAIINSVVLAPILEEIIFRGVILETVRSRWGKMWGVVVSSLLFGAVHGIPQQTINACLVGALLGGVYIATDSLLAVIILHAINNAISYILMTTLQTEVITLRSLIDSNVAYWSIYAASCVVALFCTSIIATAARERKRPKSNKNTPTIVE